MKTLRIGWVVLLGAVALTAQQPTPATGDLARDAFPIPADLRIERNLVYAEYGARTLKLDLYLPKTTAPVPGILIVRGGGWRQGDKEGFGFIAGGLAHAGFAAASIEYRTTDEAPFPAQVQDVKAGIRWLRAHARDYNIDPARIGALGGSAGAHLVALLATSAAPRFEGDGGNATSASSVQAVVAMATPTDFSEWEGDQNVQLLVGPLNEASRARRLEASPIAYVTKDAVPILLIHSKTDDTVPYTQSLRLQDRYQKAGARVEFMTIEEAPHAFWNFARWFPGTMNRAIAFFSMTLRAN